MFWGGFIPSSPKWGAGSCPEALAFKRQLHKEHFLKNHGKLIASLRHVSSDVAILDFFQSKRGSGNQSLMGEIRGGREGVFVTKTGLK